MKKLFVLVFTALTLAVSSAHAQIPGQAPSMQRLNFYNFDFKLASSITSVVMIHNHMAVGDATWFMLNNMREVAGFYSYDPTITFFEVNGFNEPLLLNELKVASYPTTLFYRMGELVKRVEGNLYPDEVMVILDEIR